MDVTSALSRGQQARMAQRLLMKRKSVRGDAQMFGDLSCGHALRPFLHEQAKHSESGTLRKRREARDCRFRFHFHGSMVPWFQ